MSARLRQYILDAYESRRTSTMAPKLNRNNLIQIDDQDDSDRLNEFCNLFCSVEKNGVLIIDLVGKIPITREIEDLSEIYNGYSDKEKGRVRFQLTVTNIDALMDLADKLRDTALLGAIIGNPEWLRVSARTISSLYRFVRIIKEYIHLSKH